MYFIYIIYSSKTAKYYIGSAIDLELRLKHHNGGHTKSTKAGAPLWVLKYTEIYPDRSTALKRERQIKKKKSRKYLEYLIGLDE